MVGKSVPPLQPASTKASALMDSFAFAHNLSPTRDEHRYLFPLHACDKDGDGFVAHVASLKAAKYLSEGLRCVVIGRKAVFYCGPIGKIFNGQYGFVVPS